MAFIVDVFAQKIVAWHASTCKDTDLAMIPLRMALWQRDRDGQPTTPGELIMHSDAGSQGGFNRSSQHLMLMEVCDGKTAAGSGSCAAAEDELTGEVGFPAGGRAQVLASDRRREAYGARRRGSQRVGSHRHSVVSQR